MNFPPLSITIGVISPEGVYKGNSIPKSYHVKEVARIATRKEARTGMLIPSEHKYLLAASEGDGKPAAVMIFDVR